MCLFFIADLLPQLQNVCHKPIEHSNKQALKFVSPDHKMRVFSKYIITTFSYHSTKNKCGAGDGFVKNAHVIVYL